MFQGNRKMHLIKENGDYALVFHEYFSEYQVIHDGGCIMTLDLRFSRGYATELFDKVCETIPF